MSVSGGPVPGRRHLGLRPGQPVPLPLEGIRRQRHSPPTNPPNRDRRRHHTPDVQSRNSPPQRLLLGAVAPQRREEGDVGGTTVLRPGGEALPGHGHQGTVGAEFEECADAVVEQAVDTVGEAHGLADVPHPVLRIAQFRGGGGATGDVGDDGDGGGPEGELARDGAELLQHPVHMGGVEGVADPQGVGLAAAFRPGRGVGGDGVRVPGDDAGAGAVDGGDGDVALDGQTSVGEFGRDLGLRRRQGDHGAALGLGLHQTAARYKRQGRGIRPGGRGRPRRRRVRAG